MTPEESAKIAITLQTCKENFEREKNLWESKTERPELVKYLRDTLIPQIDESYKIVTKKIHY